MSKDKITTILLLIILFIVVFVSVYIIIKVNKFMKIVSKEEDEEKKIEDEENKLIKEESEKKKELEIKNIEDFIIEDFGEKSIEDINKLATDIMLKIFNSIESLGESCLDYVSEVVNFKLENIINKQKSLGLKEYFEKINFSRVEIISYNRLKGYNSFVFRIYVDYIHYIKKDEKIVNGLENKKQYDIFELSLAYINNYKELNENIKELKIYMCGSEKSSSEEFKWIIIDFNRI